MVALMHLLAQEEYGLRCLLQVANGKPNRPRTIPEIAAAEGLSSEYTAKLLRVLRQSGFVASTRGAGGGYRLARPAAEITAWEVVAALGGTFFPDSFCESHPGRQADCVHTTDCSVRTLWRTLEEAVRGVLQNITIADMRRRERDMIVWLDSPEFEAGGSTPRAEV